MYLYTLLLLLICQIAECKVLIITHVYNKAEFIDYHCKTFQKFLQDDYEYIVFNDAPPGPAYDQIRAMCDQWEVQCIDIPQELHRSYEAPFDHPNWVGSGRHVDGIKYSLELLGYHHPDIVAFIDSDLFLIRPISFKKLLGRNEIASVMRYAWGDNKALTHLWPGLTILAMDRLPNRWTLNFSHGIVEGHVCDSGGFTYYYLKNNPVNIKYLGMHTDSQIIWRNKNASRVQKINDYTRAGFTRTQINWLLKYPNPDMEFFYQAHFVHIKGGRFNVDEKIQSLNDLFSKILNE